MIGICGFVRLDGEPAKGTELPTMQAALARCGTPSRIGTTQRQLALGAVGWHAQLSINVAATFHHHSPSGCIAVADARLQRRSELVRTLGLDPASTAESDAALILHAWLAHSEDCAALLDGDFAFAIWDPRNQTLFCARDGMGVRPLCFHHAPGKLFAFASATEALLVLPDVPEALDEGRIADALTPYLEGLDKTSTMYAAIQRLPPAHWLRLRDGRVKQECYWAPRAGAFSPPRSDAEWIEAFSATLEDAVARQLEGSDEVGCTLSGGMDSSALAVIARDQLDAAGRGPLRTYSSIDDNPDCRETAAIEAVLGLGGFAPTRIEPDTIAVLRDELRAAGDDLGEPFDGGMYLLHAQYLMAARQGLHALLDGIDADILLGDHGVLVRQIRGLRWRAAWNNARGLERRFPAMNALRILAGAARAALAPESLRRHIRPRRLQEDAEQLIADSILSPDFARRIGLIERVKQHAAWSTASGGSPIDRTRSALAHPYTTVGFERYRRVGARHGVDPRHPFDDRAVVELSLHLPDHLRLGNGWTKLILRQALKDRLPESVRWRTGKEHLGASVIHRVILSDHAEVRTRMTRFRPLLTPWVDLGKLDDALTNFHRADDGLSQERVFQALSLGRWLETEPHPDAMLSTLAPLPAGQAGLSSGTAASLRARTGMQAGAPGCGLG